MFRQLDTSRGLSFSIILVPAAWDGVLNKDAIFLCGMEIHWNDSYRPCRGRSAGYIMHDL